LANYAYIAIPKKMKEAAFGRLLNRIVKKRFGNRLSTSVPDWGPEFGCSAVWVVEVPNTAVYDEKEAHQRFQAPGNNLGVSIQFSTGGGQLVFRHGSISRFERWIGGCIEERLARHFGTGVYFDAIDRVIKRGRSHPNRYDYPTFREYFTRKFDKPLSKEDEEYMERSKGYVPEGWW
jgi:hypothetical protein